MNNEKNSNLQGITCKSVSVKSVCPSLCSGQLLSTVHFKGQLFCKPRGWHKGQVDFWPVILIRAFHGRIVARPLSVARDKWFSGGTNTNDLLWTGGVVWGHEALGHQGDRLFLKGLVASPKSIASDPRCLQIPCKWHESDMVQIYIVLTAVEKYYPYTGPGREKRRNGFNKGKQLSNSL